MSPLDPMSPLDLLGPLFALLFGALIGSFANVVVHRLPRGESIAFPGSHCPACNHSLSAYELVPVLSWLVQGGRCRNCRSPISSRYPAIEAIVAIGFALLWFRWPPAQAGWALLPLAALFTVLVIVAAIDLDTYTLPDVLTLPALAFALLATLLYRTELGLPSLAEALAGATVGAGLLALINRLGALVLRRFRDTRERLWPIGFDQVNLAAFVGALAGWGAGIVAAAVSIAGNLVLRRAVRIPEPIVLALWVVALLLGLAGITVSPLASFAGSLTAAGAVALAGAIYWWLRDLLAASSGAPDDSEDDAHDEPVAMGFGDVKLAAVMGALLGWEKLLLALFLSFVLGAVGGLIGRVIGGERIVPFGPYLALATVLTLFLGDALLAWYLGLLAV